MHLKLNKCFTCHKHNETPLPCDKLNATFYYDLSREKRVLILVEKDLPTLFLRKKLKSKKY